MNSLRRPVATALPDVFVALYDRHTEQAKFNL